jgi:hypothetical protein
MLSRTMKGYLCTPNNPTQSTLLNRRDLDSDVQNIPHWWPKNANYFNTKLESDAVNSRGQYVLSHGFLHTYK